MAVTAPGIGDTCAFTQGSPASLAGGDHTVAAIILSASGLVVTLMACMPENVTSVVSGVNHSSVAVANAPSWTWSTASGHSNS